MKRKMNFARISRAVFLLTLMALGCIAAQAQTTTFTYQGRLTDSTVPLPTNGTYDFEFALYDASAGGTQQGATQTVTGVNVSAGVFTVQLDFTAAPFAAGANRYLEIRVKKPADPAFVALLPRQPLTSAPYSIQSLNATNAAQLGGVAASNYLQFNGNGSQLTNVSTDAVNLTGIVPITKGGTGSATQNFVDLTTTQTVAGGKTFSSAVNTTTQYNIGGNRVLSITGTNNLFAGVNAGAANTSGNDNVFVGASAGSSNTTGGSNSFFGTLAGNSNTTGDVNSFFGAGAGSRNTTGSFNAFFGAGAGSRNTIGGFNSFYGQNTGFSNTTGSSNSFFGTSAGYSNTTGMGNSFFGTSAGTINTTGKNNSFFGQSAGQDNTIGAENSFFGTNAGSSNTTGFSNSFVGWSAGFRNTTGGNNLFVGINAGYSNTTASGNSFVGANAGSGNTTAGGNSFFGFNTGLNNTIGNNNSFFGIYAGSSNTTSSNNSFFGSQAGYYSTGNFNSFFGFNAGFNNTTGTRNSFVGVNAGGDNMTGDGNAFFGLNAGRSNTTGGINTAIGNSADVGTNLTYATAIGAFSSVSSSNTIALGRADGSDKVRVYGLGSAGSTALCRNGNNEISTCSSSLRYKTNIAPFSFGLSQINQLRPISFDWKEGGMKDVGFGTEDVAKINPLFVSYNAKGEVEGVKYDRLSVVFVNAFREQQAQIEQQRTINQTLQMQVERQQREIDALKKIVCAGNPTADICREK